MHRLSTATVLVAASSCVVVSVVATPARAVTVGAATAQHSAVQHRARVGPDDFVFKLGGTQPALRSLSRSVAGPTLVTAMGQTQWISCSGPGPTPTPTPTASGPTVVLVAGLGAGHWYWNRVQPLLQRSARVCWYDRPGLGDSPARIGRQVSTARQAQELKAALTAVGETGKLVLVGHSYGGLLARSFANQYRSQTAGLVLVDASYSTQWRYSGRYWSEGGATINMKRTQRDTYGLPRMGAKPLFVIGAGRGNSSQWQRMQAAAAGLGNNSVHVTARRSTHVVMESNPKIVAAAITAVVVAAPKKRKLASCRRTLATVWAPLGGFCGPRR